MKYYYDIDLYFYDYYINYYKWESSTNYLRLPIYKISNINIILDNEVSINTDYKYILVSDEITSIALEIIDNKVAYISSLKPSDEIRINNIASEIDNMLDIEILKRKDNKNRISFKDKLIDKLNKSSKDKIKYLYFYEFNELNNNISYMKKKLIDNLEYKCDEFYVNILMGD